MIELFDITEENWLAIRKLAVREDQKAFLDSALGIIARGYIYRANRARVIGIAHEGECIGAALVKDLDDEPACYDLQQFMIDARYQGKGFGTAALKLILSELEAERKYDCVEVCVKKEAAEALRVYEKAGFVDTGYVDEAAPDSVCLVYRFAPVIKLEKTLSGSILDIGGGGEGVIGRLYGESVTAIDNRQEELDEAPGGFTKLLMDARKLDFADGSFDNITFFYSLMFMDAKSRKIAAAEALRVLKTGGKLLVWDAEIEKAYPEAFTVELLIELGGERIKTTYGVISDIVNQTAEAAAALFTSFGAEAIRSESKNGQFYLEIIKK